METDIPHGLLLVDKPQGWTSFDAVGRVRSIIQKDWRERHGERRKFKVGHSGTLDPMATGLLVIAVGGATKRLQGLIAKDKTYEVEATFGAISSTGDAEGILTPVKEVGEPTLEELEAALARFRGEIMQVPPAYSAIKVDGKRAYDLARAGREVELEARPVMIHSLGGLRYEYPRFSFTAHVGSGTYIRSLVADIGTALGGGAYLSGLRRTTVGAYRVQDAVPADGLNIDVIRSRILPLETQ